MFSSFLYKFQTNLAKNIIFNYIYLPYICLNEFFDMIHIVLPDDGQRLLVFYLAMEEYVPRILGQLPGPKGSHEAFFTWQVPPTVIFGRNQVIEAEINLEYCREHKVNLFRRKSGGGCVYADLGNIMISYITDSTDVAFNFDRYLQRLTLILRKAGLNAERSGRNDILVNGRKVSGNAFFHKPEASIVHGTMLYDSDFEALTSAITPSQDKIRSKGVESVRQHVTNVKEELQAIDSALARKLSDTKAFRNYIIESLRGQDGDVVLGADQVAEISEIEKTYLDPDFLHGRNHSFSITAEARVENCGHIIVSLDMDSDLMKAVKVSGDYFTLKEGLDGALTEALKGKTRDSEETAAAVRAIDAGSYVMNLGSEQLLSLIRTSKS